MTETLSPALPPQVDDAARALLQKACDRGLAIVTAESCTGGLVHFACARTGRETAHREAHFGDIGRGPVRIECLRVGLQMLEEAL